MASSPLSMAEGSLGERQGLIKYAQIGVSSLRPGKEEKLSAVGQLQCHHPGLMEELRATYRGKKGDSQVWSDLGAPGCSRPPRRVPFLPAQGHLRMTMAESQEEGGQRYRQEEDSEWKKMRLERGARGGAAGALPRPKAGRPSLPSCVICRQSKTQQPQLCRSHERTCRSPASSLPLPPLLCPHPRPPGFPLFLV